MSKDSDGALAAPTIQFSTVQYRKREILPTSCSLFTIQNHTITRSLYESSCHQIISSLNCIRQVRRTSLMWLSLTFLSNSISKIVKKDRTILLVIMRCSSIMSSGLSRLKYSGLWKLINHFSFQIQWLREPNLLRLWKLLVSQIWMRHSSSIRIVIRTCFNLLVFQ